MSDQVLLQKRAELEEGVGAFPRPPPTLGELHAVLGPDAELRRREPVLQYGCYLKVVSCDSHRDRGQMFVGSPERGGDLQ